jgi:hypothetical protein
MTRDPLDGLREAWRRLEAPPMDRDAPADDATRAAVDWLRAAWQALPVPAARVRPRRSRIAARLATLLAAAALVATAAWLHVQSPSEARPRASESRASAAHVPPAASIGRGTAAPLAFENAERLRVSTTLAAGRLAPATLVVAVPFPAASGSHEALLGHALSGSRRHAWDEAATSALLVLGAPDSLPSQRCEAAVHLVQAWRALGRDAEADAYAGALAAATR